MFINKKARIGLIFIVTVAVIFIASNIIKSGYDKKSQEDLLTNIKTLTCFKFYDVDSDGSLFEDKRYVMQIDGVGAIFGNSDIPLWKGVCSIDKDIEYQAAYQIRFANDQQSLNKQYAEIQICYIKNIYNEMTQKFIEDNGFYFQENAYIIIYNNKVYRIEDQNFSLI